MGFSMLAVGDFEKLSIPIAVYISKDEPIDEYNKIVDVISKKPFASSSDQKNYDNM